MNRILCFLSIIIFSFELHAQCPEGPYFFTNQEDIDSFSIRYPDCTHIVGNVQIFSGSSSKITSVRGFDNIKKITGDLSIFYDQSIIEITGFNNLDTITKRLDIRFCENLKKVSGFKSLKSVNEIAFYDNKVLNEINLFEQLDSVGTLAIRTRNPFQLNLTSSFSLNTLSLNGDINVNTNNNELYNLGIARLDSSNHYANFNSVLEIIPNTTRALYIKRTKHFDFIGLSKFSQLNNLGLYDIDSISFSEKPNMEYPLNFSLHRVGGEIDFNTLSGLIFHSLSLRELNGLERLDVIGDMSWLYSIYISSCPSLKSVSRLENARNLQILDLSDNTSLSECNASRICDLIEINSPGVSISGNLSSCENIDSVATQCIKTSSQELTIGNSPLLFPNPCTEFINLNTDKLSSISVLNIYNINGARVKSVRDLTPRIDLSDLPEGPYLFQSVHDDGIKSKLIIIR